MVSLSGMERTALAGLAVSIAVMAVLHEVMQLKEIGNAMHGQFFEGAEDYYLVLGLKETSTQQEVETAYKRATSQFHSRNRDESERVKRARIVTAHEALANVETRKAYDARRRLVTYLGYAVQSILIGLPLMGLVFLNMKLMKLLSSSAVPAALCGYLGISWGFEGRLRRILRRVEITVEVTLSRGPPGERLGMELLPPRTLPSGGAGLEVGSITPGGVVDNSNQAVRASRLGQAEPLSWWHCPELHAGDVITSVNGHVRPEQIMQEMKESPSLCLRVNRSLTSQTLLPWIVELELSREIATERWGCQLSGAIDGSDSLEVSSNEFAGSLKRWNEAHPELCVRKGDRIVSANRELGVDKMGGQMRNPTALTAKWIIVRGVFGDSPAPSEVVSGPFRKQGPSDKLGIRIGPALDSPVYGHVIEAGASEAVTIVKEVRAGYLVDKWNASRCGPEVEVGAAVLSVNGRTDPKEFASELGKHVVLLRLRPVRGSKVVPMEPVSVASPTNGSGSHAPPATNGSGSNSHQLSNGSSAPVGVAQLLPLRLDQAEEPPLSLRLMGRFCPSRLGPRSFEVQLRSSLAKLRCEFDVELTRTESDTLGLNLQPQLDDIGGLQISDVADSSLIGEHNLRVTGRTPKVQAEDRLVMVNGESQLPPMIKALSDKSISRLELRFSRKAAEAAPGVWEAEVERYPSEGWGMELREQVLTGGRPGSGVLRIENIKPGSAVDRWNKSGSALWVVEPGDLIVAAAPEVGHDRTVAHLKANHRAKLTLLRWLSGPAPASDATTLRFEVTLARALSSDKLGIRLNPSDYDPTRTVVAEIILGGLVDRYNKVIQVSSGSNGRSKPHEVRTGDEVESINGETDTKHFAKCCQAPQLVLRLARRGGKVEELPDDSSPQQISPPPIVEGASTVQPQLQPLPTPVPPTPSVTPPLAAAAAPARLPETAPPVVQRATIAPPALAAAGLAWSEQAPAAAAGPERTAPFAASVPEVAAVNSSVATSVAAAVDPIADQNAIRENFLLNAEVEQLKQQLAAQSGLRDERNKLLMDNERLKSASASLEAERERLERREKQLAAVTNRQPAAADPDAARKIEALNSEREADQAQLRDMEQHLQAALKRGSELSEAKLRLESETGRLTAKVSVLSTKLDETVASSSEAKLRLESDNGRLLAKVSELSTKLDEAVTRSLQEVPGRSGQPNGHGAAGREANLPAQQQLPPGSLDSLGDGLARLQELSASLEHTLSCNPELSPSLSTARHF